MGYIEHSLGQVWTVFTHLLTHLLTPYLLTPYLLTNPVFEFTAMFLVQGRSASPNYAGVY